jgi:arabinogalactan endo-1,4-beta-galactosidase
MYDIIKMIGGCLWLLMALSCGKQANNSDPAQPLALLGADMSYLPEVRASGAVYYNAAGQPEDMLLTLKKAGANLVRLRLWKDPASPTSGLPMVKTLCNEVKSMGLKTLITVHYSDTWADPGHQTKPAAWQSLGNSQLNDSLYAYTQQIVTALQPDYIQLGNEINNGLLWPDGSAANLANMKALLKTAIKAVRDAGTGTKIIIHYAGVDNAPAFFANLADLDYDVIGISYYPQWHGKDVQALKQALIGLAQSNQQSILLAETAYPFSLGWNDYTNNVLGLSSQILPAYPASPQGQKDFLLQMKTIMAEVPRGLGFCYWGSEWVTYKGNTATDGSAWENQAFWDFSNKALPVLDAYR